MKAFWVRVGGFLPCGDWQITFCTAVVYGGNKTLAFYCPLQELFVSKVELKSLCDYYFDGKGKAIRPMIVVLMARALNIHSNRAG